MNPQTFYGTDNETIYVNKHGAVLLIQSPDLVDVEVLSELPAGFEPLDDVLCLDMYDADYETATPIVFTTEEQPAILHAWCGAWFLGGCTEDDEDALREHAIAQLRAAGLEGEALDDHVEEMVISFAPIPDLEAGDLCVDEEMHDIDPGAEWLTATLFVKGRGPIGEVTLRNGQIWGTDQRHWAGSKLIEWFTARGSDVSWHRDAIIEAVATAKEAM